MPNPYVHSFYRIWFTVVDPTVLFFTVLTCIFFPTAGLELIVPPSIATYDPSSHGPLLHQTAALYGFCGIIFGVLLPASPDPKIWRIVQAATLGVDVSLLATLYNLLRVQGRTNLGTLTAGDWFNASFTAWVALIRVAYLLGIGGDKAGAKKLN